MPASIVRRGALTLFLAGLVLSGMLCAPEARGAEEESATELAKKTQNPVADLISVPFQSNFNFGAGTKEETVFILNVQPVIPIKLTAEWNLTTQTIIPTFTFPTAIDCWGAIARAFGAVRLASARARS